MHNPSHLLLLLACLQVHHPIVESLLENDNPSPPRQYLLNGTAPPPISCFTELNCPLHSYCINSVCVCRVGWIMDSSQQCHQYSCHHDLDDGQCRRHFGRQSICHRSEGEGRCICRAGFVERYHVCMLSPLLMSLIGFGIVSICGLLYFSKQCRHQITQTVLYPRRCLLQRGRSSQESNNNQISDLDAVQRKEVLPSAKKWTVMSTI